MKKYFFQQSFNLFCTFGIPPKLKTRFLAQKWTFRFFRPSHIPLNPKIFHGIRLLVPSNSAHVYFSNFYKNCLFCRLKENKSLLSTEIIQLFCIVPSFYDYLSISQGDQLFLLLKNYFILS